MRPGSPPPIVLLLAVLAATVLAWSPAPATAAAPVLVSSSGATIGLTLAVKASSVDDRPRSVLVTLAGTRIALRHVRTVRDRRHRLLSTWRATVPTARRASVARLAGRQVVLVLRWRRGGTSRVTRRAERTTPRKIPAPAAMVTVAAPPTSSPLSPGQPGVEAAGTPAPDATAPAPAIDPTATPAGPPVADPPTPAAAPATPTPVTSAPTPVAPPAATPASAPPTASRDLVVRSGTASLGLATVTGSTGRTTATASVRAPALALAAGSYRLTTCLRLVVPGTDGARRCVRDTVDLAVPATVAAPVVGLTALRPDDDRQGAAQGLVTVERRTAPDTWTPHATSPTAGLAVAALALVAPGASEIALPALLAPLFDATPATLGGVDTGAPESFCAGDEWRSAGVVPPGTTPMGLGGDAPAYHEVAGPLEGPARGTMLLIHGGGWVTHGPGAVARMRGEAERWRARGWRTVSVTHRPCGAAIGDVLWFADRVLADAGDRPVCATGKSAGGHLAVLVAALRPAVDCAIGEGAPLDLASIADQRVSSGDDPAIGTRDAPRWVGNLAIAAFGERPETVSPTRLAVRGRVLLVTSRDDWTIPWEQATGFRAAQQARDPGAAVDLLRLAPGPLEGVHGSMSAAAAAELERREAALVAPLL
jgi:hypothetical protein